MATEDLRDPDFAAGRILALEKQVADVEVRERRERRAREEHEREQEDHDTLVSAAVADMREAVQELTSEVVRQGGISARALGVSSRALAVSEAIAAHLEIDLDYLAPNGNGHDSAPPTPRSPELTHRMQETERVVRELRRRQKVKIDRATRPDPEELSRARSAPEPEPSPMSRKITKTFRPETPRDWAKLAVYTALALGAIAAALQQLASAFGK